MALTPAAAIGSTAIGSIPALANSSGLVGALVGSKSASGGNSTSAGGSFNSAQSMQGSENSAWSNTAGIAASRMAADAAAKANAAQSQMTREAMDFNAKQAALQRDWEERMANTIYSRSVEDMKRAGINPILAASAGLSAASVNSGHAASIGSPSAFMGQTFAEQNSASGGKSFGSSSESGGSWNNSSSNQWSNSESGLATGLKQMSELTGAAYDAITSSEALKWSMENFGSPMQKASGIVRKGKDIMEEITDKIVNGDKLPGEKNPYTYRGKIEAVQ